MEILFRGKRINSGDWVHGYLTKEGRSYFIEVPFEFAGVQTFCIRKETIGQYAFAEALGVKIFTGDILSEHWRAEVYQDPETGTFMVHVHGDRFRRRVRLHDYLIRRIKAGTVERDHKVIGNIHDNPELLKEKI